MVCCNGFGKRLPHPQRRYDFRIPRVIRPNLAHRRPVRSDNGRCKPVETLSPHEDPRRFGDGFPRTRTASGPAAQNAMSEQGNLTNHAPRPRAGIAAGRDRPFLCADESRPEERALWPALFHGAPGRIRTVDTRFRRAVLYPLSYGGAPPLNQRRGAHPAHAKGPATMRLQAPDRMKTNR